jgi:hypothetical protein
VPPDVFVQDPRLWLRLHAEGGKRHQTPCHDNLETYLHAYIGALGYPKGQGAAVPYDRTHDQPPHPYALPHANSSRHDQPAGAPPASRPRSPTTPSAP